MFTLKIWLGIVLATDLDCLAGSVDRGFDGEDDVIGVVVKKKKDVS